MFDGALARSVSDASNPLQALRASRCESLRRPDMKQEGQRDELQIGPESAAASLAADTFRRTVVRSQILDEASLQQALHDAPATIRTDADALADFLVKG